MMRFGKGANSVGENLSFRLVRPKSKKIQTASCCSSVAFFAAATRKTVPGVLKENHGGGHGGNHHEGLYVGKGRAKIRSHCGGSEICRAERWLKGSRRDGSAIERLRLPCPKAWLPASIHWLPALRHDSASESNVFF